MEPFAYLPNLKTLAFSSFNLKKDIKKPDRLMSSYLDFSPLNSRPERFSHFSEQRKLEFVLGRICAQEALGKMFKTMGGQLNEKLNIGVNFDRSPSWPQGIVGSITHSLEGVLACTAKTDDYLSLGLDVESVLRCNSLKRIKKRVLTGFEEDLYKSKASFLNENEFVALVFSAKESLFKCLYPLSKTYFYFEHAEMVELSIERKSFTFKLGKNLGKDFKKGDLFEGHFCQSIKDHISTLIALKKTPFDLNI